MTPRTVEVFRMEHVACCNGRNLNHGPYMQSGCTATTPAYGVNGAGPSNIAPDEVCGVTDDQAPHWWHGTPDVDALVAAGWQFVKYIVPVDYARVSRGQIVFVRAQATRVGPVGIPAHLISESTWHVAWHDERCNEETPLGRPRVSLAKPWRYARDQRRRRDEKEWMRTRGRPRPVRLVSSSW